MPSRVTYSLGFVQLAHCRARYPSPGAPAGGRGGGSLAPTAFLWAARARCDGSYNLLGAPQGGKGAGVRLPSWLPSFSGHRGEDFLGNSVRNYQRPVCAALQLCAPQCGYPAVKSGLHGSIKMEVLGEGESHETLGSSDLAGHLLMV